MFKGHKSYRDAVVIKIRLGKRPEIELDTLQYVNINSLAIQRELIEHPGKYSYVAMLLEATEEEKRDVELKLYSDLIDNHKGGKEPAKWMLDALMQSSTKWKRLNLQNRKLKQLLDALRERGRILQNQSSLIKNEMAMNRG